MTQTTAVVPTTLQDNEAVIAQGLGSFRAVGEALIRIREGDLYKDAGFKTFDAYCREKWGMGPSRAYQLTDAAEVATALSTVVDAPEILNEAQARELSAIKTDAKAMVKVLKAASADGAPLTAPAIKREMARLGHARVSDAQRLRDMQPEAVQLLDKLYDELVAVATTTDKVLASWAEGAPVDRRAWDDWALVIDNAYSALDSLPSPVPDATAIIRQSIETGTAVIVDNDEPVHVQGDVESSESTDGGFGEAAPVGASDVAIESTGEGESQPGPTNEDEELEVLSPDGVASSTLPGASDIVVTVTNESRNGQSFSVICSEHGRLGKSPVSAMANSRASKHIEIVHKGAGRVDSGDQPQVELGYFQGTPSGDLWRAMCNEHGAVAQHPEKVECRNRAQEHADAEHGGNARIVETEDVARVS